MDNQDKNIEEIRDLLRKKLAETAPADNGWNIPSNQVWAGLSEELQANKTAVQPTGQQRQWLWAALAALLLLLLLRECSSHRQVVELQTELEKLETSYSDLRAACDEKQAVIENNEDQAKNDASEITEPSSGENTSPVFVPNKKPPFVVEKGMTPTQSQEALFSKKFPEKIAPTPLSLLENPIPFSSEAPSGATPFLSEKMALVTPLPILPLAAFTYQPMPPKVAAHIPKLQNTRPRALLVGSTYTGISLTGNHLTGEQPAVIANQKSLLAYRAGVGLEARFNRHWSVEMGLQYATSNMQTSYSLDVPYTNDGEFQHDDGNFDNEYNHSLPSSLGNYPAQLVLTRENTSTVEEGELMNLDLTIRQNMRFFSLPLQLRYGFGKNPLIPIQIGVRGGFVANRTLGISSEVSSLVSHHGAIHQRHTSIGNPAYDELQKTTFDYMMGLDARYSFSPRFSMSLETGFQQGITPIYKNELVKNYLKAWNMGIAARLIL